MGGKVNASRFLKAKRALFDKLYENLNKQQREAVFSVNGPLLVLAGAGTGKTTVLVNRIAFIIRYGNAYFCDGVPSDMTETELERLEKAVSLSKDEIAEILNEYITEPCPPWALLCITFTNKAANEMKERLSGILGEEYARDIWAGTFHSVCLRLLRKYSDRLGYGSGFTVYDTDDSKRLIASCMKELNIDDKYLPVKTVLTHISSLKDKLKTPSEFAAEIGNDYRLSQLSSVYTLYQKHLKDANAVDFDDIIMLTVKLLENDAEARDYCTHRFKYVSVDEFQDTNYAQMQLVKLLSGHYNNLMVVGDDDQSIYKFRGATIENILNFDREYADAKVIRLEENYRSVPDILGAANGVIKKNTSRHEKELRTSRENGDKVVVRRCDNQTDEAKYIINKIIEMVIREKRKYSDFAVLYRMNAQSNVIEQVFARSGVPHRVLAGMRFYDRKEVKDIMAYLCVVNNPNDDLRLKRIINEPKRKIGDKTVSDIEMLAAINGKSMFDIMSESSKYPQICKSAPKLKEFVSLINGLREINENETLHGLFEKTIDMSGYRAMLISEGDVSADKLENVKELVTNAVEFEKTHEDEECNLAMFLEEVSLMSDIDNYDADDNAVTLMTVHSAKGLEFPVVFLPGMEEGIFPGAQSTVYPEDVEEERRLAYVAITRAKDKLFCIHTKERMMFGRTQYNDRSRFITEIPDKYILTDDENRDEEHPVRPSTRQKKVSMSKEFFTPPSIRTGSTVKTSFTRFSIGDRVLHQVFGEGTVLSAREMGTDVLYEIAFDSVGTKKLMATFAKLKRA